MLKEFLSAKGVKFEAKDVMQDTSALDELKQKTGAMSVPTVVVDDKDIVVGFDRGKLSRLLGLEI